MNATTTETSLPPSALAVAPAAHLSSKYVFVDTRRVIQALGEHDICVRTARGALSRKRDPLHNKHQIIFAPAKPALRGAIAREGELRVIYTNSHDGSSGVSLRAGFYRFVCSNGLVIGTDVLAMRARHVGDAAAAVIERVRAMAADTVKLQQQFDAWRALRLTRAQQEEYAALAGELRYGERQQTFDPKALLQVHRADDAEPTLWNTYNVVQENTTRGGISGFSAAGRRVRAQPLTGFDRDAAYNGDLWDLTAEVAEVLAA